ncbi:MAG: protease inhibitor I42 family protein [Gammaproteobacteria bacterium]|nr:protease inhibitor I42 family protein [Gammaproteobacteria bacterium]
MQVCKYIVLLCLFFSVTSLAQGSKLELTDPNKPILVSSVARQFTISLNSNPTTGYSWRLKTYDSHIVTPLSQTFKAPASNKPGAGGIETFVFELKEHAFKVKRVTQITFIYVRPWNLDIAKTLSFNVISV